MEEILASIKRVIAEDGRASGPVSHRPSRRVEARAEPEPPQSEPDIAEDDILELDDPVTESDGLMSQNAAFASRQSLAALAAMRAVGEHQLPANDGPLEAVVREMLRPMLKDWLDQRLPLIVEELVTREIARITAKNL